MCLGVSDTRTVGDGVYASLSTLVNGDGVSCFVCRALVSCVARAVYMPHVVLHIARIAERDRLSVYGLLYRLKGVIRGVVRAARGDGPDGGLLDQQVVRDLGACM